MTDTKKHYHVAFAASYAHSHFPTLNAASAVWRIEALLDDTKMLDELREASEAKEIPFGNQANTYEIIDYYLVGFVTCLEWHARSRIVDLLLFYPDRIETSDLRNIDKVALSQMAAANVTLPHIVGAATKVSSIRDYLTVFERIFSALAISTKPEQLLRTAIEGASAVSLGHSSEIYDALNRMFTSRNRLVHEIDSMVLGSYLIRDSWTPASARLVGEATLQCVRRMEAELTKSAPRDFPNRLDENWRSESEFDRLRADIQSMENEISSKASDEAELNPEAWQDALAASRASLEKEINYIQYSAVLRPVRHYDIRGAVAIELLRSRLSYLTTLRKEID